MYGGITLYAGTFQSASTSTTISYSVLVRQNQRVGPTTPNAQRLPAITRKRFGLFRFRSPLLSESLLFSLPVGTEMFHFPTFPPTALCVQAEVTGHDSSWVSPFGNPRITARLPTSRGLSQAPTSFIGSWCQGIHHVPLVACHFTTKMLASTMQISNNDRSHQPHPHITQRQVRWSDIINQKNRSLDPSGPNSVPSPPPHPPPEVPHPPSHHKGRPDEPY